MKLSDELLMAYVDGQLDKPQMSVVGRILHDDPELGERVARFQKSQAYFLDIFGNLVREGMASGPRPRRNKGAKPAGMLQDMRFTAATIGAMILVLGASAGFTAAYYSGMTTGGNIITAPMVQLPPANWPEDMAEFHAFFTAETVAVSPDSQTNPEVVKFQLADFAHLGTLPDFSAHGLKFLRGQMLHYRGNKLMQLIYMGKNTALVALYITPGGLDMAMTPGLFGDVKTIGWSANEMRFVLAGDMTLDALRALAAVTQHQFNKS